MISCLMPNCDGKVREDYGIDLQENTGNIIQVFPCEKCGRLHTLLGQSAETFFVIAPDEVRCSVLIDWRTMNILYKDGHGNILATAPTASI